MQLDVYLRETANHAVRLEAMLLDAKARLASEGVLSSKPVAHSMRYRFW